jgi:hypothetical protein
MPENEARAWWADVQHVRESIERRRGGAETAAPDAPEPGRRFTRADADEPPVPRLDDLDWPSELPRTRRFERSAGRDRADGGPAASDDARVTRRHTAVATEAERAVARGRRPRAESAVPRSRSHRTDEAPATAHGTGLSATDAPAAEPRGRAADATGRRPSTTADFDFERALAPASRRTVQITGRTVPAPALPRLVEVERRRPGRRPAERVGPRPDRIAMYAVLLGFFLILVAATSAHAAI